MALPPSRLYPLLTILAAFALRTPVPAGAHAVNFNVGGTLAKLDTRKEPAKHKFVFKASRQILVNPIHDPSVNGSKVLVRWNGENAGRTDLITLDPAKWKALGSPAGAKGYKYVDKKYEASPIKRVVYKPGGAGGSILITGGGAQWPWETTGPVDSVEIFFGVYSDTDPNDLEWYCTEFGGDVRKNEAGLFLAKKAAAPSVCPAEICGNGEIEGAEECDDGNLDDSDGCTSACEISDCVGTPYATTWDAVQAQIFDAGGCVNDACHGASALGGLDLRPGAAYASLVGAPSTISPLDRVEPGEESASFLYQKLASATLGDPAPGALPGTPMPAGGLPAVDVDRLAGLREWIRAGAPETGTVLGTEGLFDGCFGDPTPNKIPPLDPPAPAQGVQFYAPPWHLPANSEDEVCYATYYDLTGQVPASALTPCPVGMGGPLATCIRHDQRLLAQDPQSHHSIIQAYIGAYDWTHAGWGGWSCLGARSRVLRATRRRRACRRRPGAPTAVHARPARARSAPRWPVSAGARPTWASASMARAPPTPREWVDRRKPTAASRTRTACSA